MNFNWKKVRLMAACLFVAGLLAGCGDNNEKTKEAMQLIQELNYQGALELFEEAAALEEDYRLIARGRGIAYMGLTEYEQAAGCFQAALAGSSGFVENMDFDLNYYLAAAYTKNGQFAEAEAAYNAILAMRPDEEDACFLRGSVRLAQGDYEHARPDFEKVLSMDGRNFDRLIEIYQVLEYYGYREVGQEFLQNVFGTREKDMSVYDKGRIYYYMGEYQKASLALEEAKEKGGADSYLYLGKAYEATGEYNYAANVYNSYLAKDNKNAEIYNQLGVCEMAKQDYQKALEAFQAGLQIENSGMVQTLSFNQIMAYEYLGEYQTASALLDDYMLAYPDDETAGREQQFLSSR